MVECEIGGERIEGVPIKIVLEDQLLIVCRKCAKYGRPYRDDRKTKSGNKFSDKGVKKTKMEEVAAVICDGILIDGNNVAYCAPKGTDAFALLGSLHEKLVKSGGFPPTKVKIVLDNNGPYLMGIWKGDSSKKSPWQASKESKDLFKQWYEQFDNKKIVYVCTNISADEMISDLLMMEDGDWYVISNDRFLDDEDKIETDIETLRKKGKVRDKEQRKKIRKIYMDNLKDLRKNGRLVEYRFSEGSLFLRGKSVDGKLRYRGNV